MKIRKLVLASSLLSAVVLFTAASQAASIIGDWYGTYTLLGYTQSGNDPPEASGGSDTAQLSILASHGSSFGNQYVGTWSRKNGKATVDYSKALTVIARADSGDPKAIFKLKIKNVTASNAHGISGNMVEKQRIRYAGVMTKLKANGVYSGHQL